MTIKNTKMIALILGIAVIALGAILFLLPKADEPLPEPEVTPEVPEPEPTPFVTEATVGWSVQERPIEQVSLGNGPDHLLFVGGMHGGYEWNSVLLAYETITYLKNNPDLVPDNLTIDIIPNLNPDGLYEVIGFSGPFTLANIPDPDERIAAARFNANGVDLNRNFGCKWAPQSTWKGETVSAGTAAFSEPEAQALRDVVQNTQPKAVIFWHSKAGNVYASECENGVLPETLTLMETYATAANYGKVPVFDAYPITGDAEGWLASLNIPAVTVEMATHNTIELTRNLEGTVATLKLYTKDSSAQ